MLSPF
jgi:hypothetical protein